MGDVYQITKKLCGKKNSTNIPVRNKQGTLLTAEKDQEIQWTKHFKEVLNRSDPTNIPEITGAEEDLDINLDTPSKEELVKAIQCLKNNKAPGKDQLSAELFKTDPSLTADILLPIFHKIWQNNTIPRTWTEGNIIKLPKKGDLSNCNNWRGITLLSIPSKAFSKIIIDRIRTAVDKQLRQEQAGFRKGKSCCDQIFVLRNITEQCTEWQRQLIINFIDFEKAFDSIHRESLWKILRHYGIPAKIVQLVRMFYTEFKCSVGDSKSGVRQGCVMSSLLFILSIDWVMRSSLSDGNTGIRWTLFSHREDLDYADDLALLSHLENNMQDKTSRLQQNATSIGLNINIKKTEVMALNCRVPPDIEINGNHLKCSSSFTYLGSTVTSKGGADKDIQSRIGKARGAFVKLHNIWRSRNISRKTKMKLYNSCVLSVLLYGAECWRMTERDINRLSTFHNNCLRKICRIFWPQKITIIELHRTTGSEDMSTLLKRKRWRWIGHVLRKPADDLTRVAMRWTPEGKRKRGRPKNTWRRTVEAEIREYGYTWGELEKKAKDRDQWRILTLKAVKTSLSSTPDLDEVVCDFEAALYGGIERGIFPSVTIHGFTSHWCQRVYCKINELGLQTAYKKKGPVYRLKKPLALSYLPRRQIRPTFDELRQPAGTSEKLVEFFIYTEATWFQSSVWGPVWYRRPSPSKTTFHEKYTLKLIMAVRYSRLCTEDPELGSAFDFGSAFSYSNTARNQYSSAFQYSKVGMDSGSGDVLYDVVKQTMLSRVCHYILLGMCSLILVITFPISIWFSMKTVKQYERVVVYRLGRYVGSKGPGMVFVLPCIDKWQTVDLRIRAFNVPPQQLLTADGGIIELGADVHFRIIDPMKSISCIIDMNRSLRVLVKALLTNQLVQRSLADIEKDKLQLLGLVQSNANMTSKAWGIEISRVELSPIKVMKTPEAQGIGKPNVVMPPGLANLTQGGTGQALFEQITSFVGSIAQGNQGNQTQMYLSKPEDIAVAAASANYGADCAATLPGPTPQDIMSVVQSVLSDSLVKSVDAIYQFEIQGPTEVELYYLDLKNGNGCTGVGKLPFGSPDVDLTMSYQDMQSMFLGSLSPLQAYMSGRLQVSGDLGTAQKLKEVFRKISGKF
ncbi:hypothetical protein ScPMuIL_012325 [Solemya velum]